MLAGLLALLVAAFFTGAAAYVLVAEQPARLKLEDKALLAQWQPSYKRGAAMQASIAMAGAIIGLICWWEVGAWTALAGAIALILPWPWTILVIKPTNDRLLASAAPDADTRALIERWGRLHGVRIALGAVATILFLATTASWL